MQIADEQGDILHINVDIASLAIRVSVNDGEQVWLSRQQILQLLPGLKQAHEAIEDAYVVAQKIKLDNLRAQVTSLQAQIAEIEAL